MTRILALRSSARPRHINWRWPTLKFSPTAHMKTHVSRVRVRVRACVRVCVRLGRSTLGHGGVDAAHGLYGLFQVDLLEGVPDLLVRVLLERVEVASDRAREERRVLHTIATVRSCVCVCVCVCVWCVCVLCVCVCASSVLMVT
jgi:hypothetical protein